MTASTDNARLSKACRALLALIPTLPEPLTQAQLAERLGCSQMTVHRGIATLAGRGLIARHRQDRGWAGHAADRLTLTDAGQHWLTEQHSRSRVLNQVRKVQQLPAEVEQLRSAMRAAGLTAGFGNLHPEVADELAARVRALGVRAMVAAAVAQTWGTVRHVAAYLKRWRELRPPRPVYCPEHPGQPPRGCPECAERRAAAVPMPTWFRQQLAGRLAGPPPGRLLYG